MDTLRFAEVARVLGAAGRSLALTVPAFRSPPRKAGVTRTLRRHQEGAVVSVVIRDRPDEDVIVDLVAGVLAANDQTGRSPNRELLLEAAYDACQRDSRPDRPAPDREALGLKARPVDEAVEAAIERVNHPGPRSPGSDPPCLDDPAEPAFAPDQF